MLIVGHSNTNGRFVNTIIGEKKYQDLDENDYATFYWLTVSGETQKVEVLEME